MVEKKIAANMIIESICTNIDEEAKFQTILSGILHHQKVEDSVDKTDSIVEVNGKIK